ncbi:nucleoside-diphosphate-sugar epimerase [Edaphobacter aggregans]|uniref:Nucleoside-diphosphate-sugar epimerase n=1 Tax=Edaphobacter aggregans TaxID=570835 RepID=A0A3R9PT13_9BACT|nr:NAD(P)-dependent oxidoreductase [Edaphobacter aggregans]RSL17275.1 nucleoside-diphosphate-sugar epimerase [Edaphobacter aggregans]
MSHLLVTGASGFFGGVLKRRLLREGHTVVNIDLEPDEDSLPGLTSIQGDLRDAALLQRTFAEHRFDAVYHVAAQLAHGMKMDEHLLWTSNVDATRLLAETARNAGIRPFVFVSTNCLWASNLGHPVQEDRDIPAPIELYGKSKLAAEQLLQDFTTDLDVVIIRCPTIMDAGRLGLLAILYEFIDDHKTVWVVGDGSNRYQFIYAEDLATACIQAASYGKSDLFHIGSDDVKSMRQVYEAVIQTSGSKSKVRSLPKAPTIAAMMAAHKLRVSPLGPYHYKMIAESFVFDTTRIKQRLNWKPTLTNEEMLLRAYDYYAKNRAEIANRTNVSTHRKPASMGVIRLLKWIS